MEEWLKVSEVAEETGIPGRTIHRYIKRHPDFLTVREEHQTKLLRREDLPVLRRIRRLYKDGNTQGRVEGLLDEENDVTRTLTVQEEDNLPRAVELLQSMAEEQQRLADRVDDLTEQLEKEQRLREKQAEERDRRLVETMREIQESKPQTFWEWLRDRLNL